MVCRAGAKRQRSGPSLPKPAAASSRQPEADAEGSQVAASPRTCHIAITTKQMLTVTHSAADGPGLPSGRQPRGTMTSRACLGLRQGFVLEATDAAGARRVVQLADSVLGPCRNCPKSMLPQEDEPLGRHPAGGFVSELPEPLNVSRPARRGVGAEDFAPPETLKVRRQNCNCM